MKYILLLNSILYKSYEYSKLDYFIFCINLINRIISYLIFFIFCYDLYINYSNNKLMLLSYLIYDVFLLYDANKLIFLKIVGKNFDLMLKPKIKDRIRLILVIFLVITILLSIGIVITEFSLKYKFYLINNLVDTNFEHYCLYFFIFYTVYLKLSVFTLFFGIIHNLISIFDDFLKDIDKNLNSELYKLSNELLVLRQYHNKIISRFNDVISNLFLFYTIPTLYIFIEKFQNFDFMCYCHLAFFVIFCIFYNHYLDKLDSNLKLLNSLCTSNSYIKNYIIRNKNVYHIQTNQDNLKNINKNELEIKNFFIDIENSKSIDWIIFIEILKLNWSKFNIFGVDIENSTIIRKLISVVILILFGRVII